MFFELSLRGPPQRFSKNCVVVLCFVSVFFSCILKDMIEEVSIKRAQAKLKGCEWK